MESYFAKVKQEELLFLDAEESYHIVKVMRHKLGSEIIVTFAGQKYKTNIVQLTPVVVCKIISKSYQNEELTIKVTLVMALLKEKKFDDVIKKAVELGVYRIVPIQMQHCVSRIDNKVELKLQRWQAIAKAAAKQANRNIIPEIMPLVKNIKDLKVYISAINYVANENDKHYFDISKSLLAHKSVTIVIGPEGGISSNENIALAAMDFVNIRLGPTILRAETAALYFQVLVNYYASSNK